jgi:hypothetical protein
MERSAHSFLRRSGLYSIIETLRTTKLAMRSRSVGPFITALICGLVTTGLLWPDLSAPSAHDTSLGLLIVSLSFILGPVALYIAYVPAVAAGAMAAVVSYLLIRIGSRSRDDPATHRR